MKFLRIIGGLIGLALVSLLLHQVGWESVRQTFSLLGWGYGIVILYPLTWILLNTRGWKTVLPRQAGHFPFFRLVQIRLAGETFNSLLPSGYVGGEPLKAKLLAETLSLREATSSVLIAKSAQSLGMVLFIGLGLSLAHPGGGSPWRKPGTLAALILLAGGIFIFTILLANRSFSRLGRALHRLTRFHWLQAQEHKFIALDESLGVFYREGRGRFLQSVVWHGLGWLAGALELGVIFRLIGHPLGWRDAWFMAALAQLAAIIGFLSPASVGFYESAHYMAAVLLGLPPALGLSVSLIRRVREIFWDIVGIFLFWRLTKRRT